MNINNLFAPAIVTAVIGAIVTIIQMRTNNKIAHVSEERKAYRDAIRKIAINIESSSADNINIHLAELKTRINPYSRLNYSHVYRDGHIWKVIDEIENNDNVNIKNSKKLLVEYISVLIKHSWDYTKGEVRGNASKSICNVCIVGLFVYYTFTIYVEGIIYKADEFNLIFLGVLIVSLLITANQSGYIANKVANQNSTVAKNEQIKPKSHESPRRYAEILKSKTWGFFFIQLILILLYSFIIYRNVVFNNMVLVLILFIAIFFYSMIYKEIELRINYIEKVNEIYEYYKELD